MKVLMLVISSNTEVFYHGHRKLWASYMNSNPQIECYFIQYRDGLQAIEGNTFWLNGKESFPAILTKTIDSIDFFLKKDSYDFIVRTNLSSLWNFTKLLEYLERLPREKVYNGIIGNYNNKISYISGAGFIITPDVGRLLIENRKISESVKIIDDVDIGVTLNTLGIKCLFAPRNDTMIYNKDSFHYRCKQTDRRTEVENMSKLLKQIYEYKIVKDDIITTDKYLQAFQNYYYKFDSIVSKSPIIWRGKIHNPPTKNQPLIVSGHSDYGITDDLVKYYIPTVWWTVNKQTCNTTVHSLPLGITNNTTESGLHPIYGNLDSMIQVMEEVKQDVGLVYMNFNISTYPQERQQVYDMFKDKEWVTHGNIENTLEGRTRFLRDIRNHRFVLCPRGNGVDTHRLWETLYMGSIPIVKRDIALKEFEDLPICFIDSWEEVTQEFLEKEKQRILSSEWNMEKLKVSYWIDTIKQSF